MTPAAVPGAGTTPALERLLERLSLVPSGDDVLRDPGAAEPLPRLFGGQVAAQALAALGATVVPGRDVHNLHVEFVGLATPGLPLDFHVTRLKDGRSFSIRQVSVRQSGRVVLAATGSFHDPEPGPAYCRPWSGPPDLEGLPRWEERFGGHDDRLTVLWRQPRPIDLRYVDGPPQLDPLLADRAPDRLRTVWRADGPLPDDPLLHACLAVYASDTTLLETALLPLGTVFADGRFHAASLNHTMWFHGPFRADSWLVHEQEASWTGGGRGLATSRTYDLAGRLVATAAQEGLLRPAAAERADVGMPRHR